MHCIDKKENKIKVTRPNDLLEARFDLSARQNDIIDMVLDQVKDDDNLNYKIKIKNYLYLFQGDISNIYRDLKNAAKEFTNNKSGFTLYNYQGKKEVDLFWFTAISYYDANGEIEFSLSPAVKNLYITMKNFTSYELKYPINLKGKYSKRLYYYLKRFQDTHFRVDKVNELTSKLVCPASYSKFSILKGRVIDPAIKEINQKTDIYVEYSTVYESTKVVQLKFTINKKSNPSLDMTACANDKYENEEDLSPDVGVEELPLFEYMNIQNEIVSNVRTIIKEDISDKDCVTIYKAANGNIDLIKEKYMASMKIKHIHNFTGFLIASIKKDFQITKKENKGNSFNNFHQRKYDYEMLEKELLNR